MAEEYEYTREVEVAGPQNQRNVAALESVLDDWDIYCADPKSLAHYLASRGVLVPSALTDEEAHGIGRHQEHPALVPNFARANAAAVRGLLERIARGEQP